MRSSTAPTSRRSALLKLYVWPTPTSARDAYVPPPDGPGLICGGPLRMIDDENFDRALGRFELQPELFHRGENDRQVGLGRDPATARIFRRGGARRFHRSLVG